MKLNPFFNTHFIESEKFIRNDQDKVINLVLEDGQKKYFLKEIQSHSMREGLDVIYHHLNSLQPKLSNWILPLARHDDPSIFLFKKDEKNLLLFPFVQYESFSNEKISLKNLWEGLEEFHQLIKNKNFAKQDYRNYQSWLQMGSTRLKNKFGGDLPFLSSFDEFMEHRFPQIQFLTGPIHWDIYEDNVGLDAYGKLVLLDFDLVQEGTYAQELIAAAAMYIDWKNPFEEKIMEIIYQKIKPLASGLIKEDLKFLLARNVFGDLALLDSKQDLLLKLGHLKQASF